MTNSWVQRSGDTTPYRMTRVTLHTGLYPQKRGVRKRPPQCATRQPDKLLGSGDSNPCRMTLDSHLGHFTRGCIPFRPMGAARGAEQASSVRDAPACCTYQRTSWVQRFGETTPYLTPTSIKLNRFLKMILLENKQLLECFGFVTSQKWLVSREINLRKPLNLIDVGAEYTRRFSLLKRRFLSINGALLSINGT